MGFLSDLFDPGKDARDAGIAASREAALRNFNVSGPSGSAYYSPNGGVSLSLNPQLQGVQQQLFGQLGQQPGVNLDMLNMLANRAIGGIGGVGGAGGFTGAGFLPQLQQQASSTVGGPFDPNRQNIRALNQAAFGLIPGATQGIAGAEQDALARLRAQAAPAEAQAMAGLNERLFGTGQGAVTGNANVELGGGRLAQAFGRGLGQADLDRQVAAQGLALERRTGDQSALQGALGASSGLQGISEQLMQGLFGRTLGAGQFAQGIQSTGFEQGLAQQGFNNQALQQAFGIGGQQLGAQQAFNAGNIQNQMALLGGIQGLQQLPLQLFGAGLNAETSRSNAQLGVGQNQLNAAAATPNPFLDIVTGVLGAAGGSGGFASLFSDRRLKDDLTPLMDDDATGLTIYSWTWNKDARRIGADKAPPLGLIAQEVQEKFPEAVGESRGFLTIDYRRLIEATGV